MPRPKGDSRDQFVAATSTLLRRRGYHNTSIKEIAREAGAPIGSLYFLFPGGKDELVLVAIRKSGGDVAQILNTILDDPDTAHGVVKAYVSLIEAVLAGSDYQDGCPIATVALEVAPHHEQLTEAIGLIFTSWHDVLKRHLHRVGLTHKRSDMIASLSLAAVEGALVIARSQQSTEIFQQALAGLSELVQSNSKAEKRTSPKTTRRNSS
jgi:TetR/AcrR family transcriptional regulator, lmrAB and yxaGH operons repressor